jgi:hypothetical protein
VAPRQRDRDGDDREAVEEVRGAVQRIDQPVAVRCGAAPLLADERDVGGGLREERGDRALARAVDLGDVVAGALLHPFARPAGVHDRLTADAGRPGGDR